MSEGVTKARKTYQIDLKSTSLRKHVTTDWFYAKREFEHKGIRFAEYICDSSKFKSPKLARNKNARMIWIRNDHFKSEEEDDIKYPFFFCDLQTDGPETRDEARAKLADAVIKFYGL